MCTHHEFNIRNNVATFAGTAEVHCLPSLGINPVAHDVTDQLKEHVTGMLLARLRAEGYDTGEGLVTVRLDGMLLHVKATIGAVGPDRDLLHHFYSWAVFTPTRSASG